jgi:hypothetical protein
MYYSYDTMQHCENLVCTQFIVYIRKTSATLTFGLKTITTDCCVFSELK